MRRLLVAAVVTLFTACESATSERPAGLLTLFDLAEGRPAFPGVPPFPAEGGPPDMFVKRDPATGALKLPVQLAFGEDDRSAYVTTELWAGFPAVWVQPMYVLAVRTQNGLTELPKAGPIFSVSPKSRFYSSYWQVQYAIVDPETPPDRYTSARQILEDKLPLVPGEGRLCALVPPGTAIDRENEPAKSLVGAELGGPTALGQGWVDGEAYSVLGFGKNRFTWNERREVHEQPLFMFATQDASGALVPTGLPPVGGTGPLFSRRPAIGPEGKPAYGSLWRLYLVKLPAGAGVVLPENETPPPGLMVKHPPPIDRTMFLYQVTPRASCFMTNDCTFLTSQSTLEKELPTALFPTDVLVTCPWITAWGKAVR